MTDKNLGHATAYGYAKSKGYTGTEEEFAELMASYAEVATDARGYADQAEQSASDAQTSATNASASATTAGTKASEASASALSAQQSATSASTSAGNASASANSASTSAQTATTKASEAEQSATSASESASTAVSAKDDAVTAKEGAETAKADAEKASEEAQESAQTVANKADKDGTYPDMTVGGVMSSDGSTDSTPYIYRESGGGVEVGTVEEDSIVGGTVAFNQLVQNGNFADASGWSSTQGTFSVSGNKATVTVSSPVVSNNLWKNIGVGKASHKYLLSACLTASKASKAAIRYNNVETARIDIPANAKTLIGGVINYGTTDSVLNVVIYYNLNTALSAGDTCVVESVMAIDLTQMFGSTIADYIYSLEQSSTGAGVAFFRKLFPKDYYEYNSGELMSVEGLQSHDMVGFNQLERAENGTSALPYTNTLYGQVKLLPNTTYCLSFVAAVGHKFYTNEKLWTNRAVTGTGERQYVIATTVAELSEDDVTQYDVTYGWRLCKNSGGNTVLPNFTDVCINISSDRNGEYEPYIKHSYPLDSSLTLRGIPKVSNGLYFDGDTYEADGTVTRKYGVVDLGTLTWQRAIVSTYDNIRYYTKDISTTITKFANTTVANVICTKYQTASANDGFAKVINPSVTIDSFGTLAIYDSNSDYTDASTFKTAMSGVYLIYELATPTTESAEPYDSIQKVSKYGTEEYVSTGIVPVGHVTKYPTDIVAKVNGLPSDFSTLIAPTEKEFKASRAYSVNQFLIVNNQLYRVTSAIASGATITVGTNVVATTVADILTQLLVV